MFTGLVQDVGQITSIQQSSEGSTLTIQTSLPMDDWELGESVACDGVCLTVTHFGQGQFTVDCSPETLRCTTLGNKKPQASIHLERALRVGDRLGGHLVSGHVDGVGQVVSMAPEGNAMLITFAPPTGLLRYMIAKGSIAIDGVSLTLNDVDHQHCSVAIIPHTQDKTHLGKHQIGDAVNIEVDQVGKYIERMVKPWRDASQGDGGIDEAFLKKHGFA